jgi:hypothetical protein
MLRVKPENTFPNINTSPHKYFIISDTKYWKWPIFESDPFQLFARLRCAQMQKISSDKRALTLLIALMMTKLPWKGSRLCQSRAAAERVRMWTASGRHAHSSLKGENWCQRCLWTVLDFSEWGIVGAVHSSHPNLCFYLFLLFSCILQWTCMMMIHDQGRDHSQMMWYSSETLWTFKSHNT